LLETRARPAARGASRGTRLTGEARTFAADELIVSKTDLRGVVAPLYEQLLAEERRHPTAEAAVTGLSQPAERLRSEATGFLAAMRR
jgi:hypothetical protein